jgi:starch synthase
VKVVFVSAEVAPFAKVGGLADVAAALPRALHQLGVEVAVVMPKYRGVGDKTELLELGQLEVPVGGERKVGEVFQGTLPGAEVPVYFLAHDPYFDRPHIYGEAGGDYPDSLARFTFLSRGAVELCRRLSLEPDVIHANDWHTALIPVYQRLGLGVPGAKTILTVHNLAYQGVFPWEQAPLTGVPEEGLGLIKKAGKLNLLRGGILSCDLLTTVSPTYAREILEQGEGLEEELGSRREALVGVLNGVDYEVWNPETDPYLWANYSPQALEGKWENKRRLQEELGLEQAPGVPLVGMISRLAEQKGFDLVMGAFDRLLALGIQFVLLGTGDPRYEEFFRGASAQYPGRVAALITFSEAWAHRIEAACDIFLMPSRFEPCGLNQMYSLRYGAVPVVRATGGLVDTVRECDPERGTGNGFLFRDYTPEALLGAVRRAVQLYREQPKVWRELMVRGMREDHSWGAAARQYVGLYRELTGQSGA